MLSSELATAVAEGIKIIVVLVVNHGFQSIGALSESVGVERFGTAVPLSRRVGTTRRRHRYPSTSRPTRRAYGATVLRARTIAELRDALVQARSNTVTTVVHIETDPLIAAPDSESWWDVPVAEVSERATTRSARGNYEAARGRQRGYLRPTTLRDGKPDTPS